MSGIGGTAKWSEVKVCKILDNACLMESIDDKTSKDGDVYWNGIHIEVKSTSKNEIKKDVNMNQVRPMQLKPLVCVTTNLIDKKYENCDFIVYPASYVLLRGAKGSGQHTPDGVCVYSWTPTKKEIKRFGCKSKDLKKYIIKACEISEKEKELIDFCIKRIEEYKIMVHKNHDLFKKYKRYFNEVSVT